MNALRSVVRYYPGQDLSGETISICHPYPVLVHHFEELATFRDRCATVPVDELCQSERDASAHLSLLLDYLDTTIMPGVRLEQDRLRRGYSTWEYQWLLLKPGTTFIEIARDNADITNRPAVVRSVEIGMSGSRHCGVCFWRFQYDHGSLMGIKDYLSISGWDGEVPLRFRIFEPETILRDEEAKRFVESGKLYWKMFTKQCKYYKGRTSRFPFRKVGKSCWIGVPTPTCMLTPS
jgi:hypothetical protein